MAVLAHIGVFIGIFTEQATSLNFLIVTPLSIAIFTLNALIVYGLRRKKTWAYLLGCIEMMFFVAAALVNIWTKGFSGMVGSLLLLLFSISMLLSLRNEFSNHKRQEE
jgi:uncharacterized membrane protein